MTVDQRILQENKAKTRSSVSGRNQDINYLRWRAAVQSHWLRQMPRRSPPVTECKVSREGQGRTARVKAGRQLAEASPAHLIR